MKMVYCIQYEQKLLMKKDYINLQKGKRLGIKSRIMQLRQFLDPTGTIRFYSSAIFLFLV